jgi:hypothetical protein
MTGSVTTLTYKQWEECIATHFEKNFYIPLSPTSTEPRPDLVHRSGIYKDSCGAGQPWADYQLRCNFPIAMVAVSTISSSLPPLTESARAFFCLSDKGKAGIHIFKWEDQQGGISVLLLISRMIVKVNMMAVIGYKSLMWNRNHSRGLV